MSADRLNVFPSEAVKKAMKDRLAAAKSGLKLLKKKSDAIKVKLHRQMVQLKEIKDRLGENMKDTYYSHSEASWAAGGNFNGQVLENVPSRASYRVQTSLLTFSGVKVPAFAQLQDNFRSKDQAIGLTRGGMQIKKCQHKFEETLGDLVHLASLQTSIKTLDTALQVTNRRVNALEFVIIPRFTNTLSYIESELDEGEREDQNRIKKVKAIREQQSRAQDEAMDAFRLAGIRRQREQAEVDEQKSSGNSLVSSPTSAAEVSASSAAPERDEQFLAGEETSPDLLALFAEVDAEAEQDY